MHTYGDILSFIVNHFPHILEEKLAENQEGAPRRKDASSLAEFWPSWERRQKSMKSKISSFLLLKLTLETTTEVWELNKASNIENQN